MKTDIENLRKITLGALRINENDGLYSFHRFGRELEAYHCNRGETVKTRALSTSNIKLEFYTKGGTVSFDYEITPGVAREYYSVDLTVDGIYRYSVSKNVHTDADCFLYEIPYSGEEKRVTVYFPTTACLKLKNLVIPDDFKPHRRKNKILVLGDSLYQGYHPNHFQNTCMNILSDELDADMINQSIGGDCFNKDNIERVEFDADFIIVGYGVNDWACGRFKNGEDADAYVERLVSIYPSKRIVLVLPADNDLLEKKKKNDDLLFENEGGGVLSFEDVRNVLRRIASKYENVITLNAKNYKQQYPESFYSDNVHLTDLGNIIFANNMIKDIKKLFPELQIKD